MFITRLKLHNWRNFRDIDIELQRRVFIVGANATGKSNLLDALRFLRDVAKDRRGGLQSAIGQRSGFSNIHSLTAPTEDSEMSICVDVADEPGAAPEWSYALSLREGPAGQGRLRPTFVTSERAAHRGKPVLVRPSEDDQLDKRRLTQTALEQISSNSAFRPIADFLASINYVHPNPPTLRSEHGPPDDPGPSGSSLANLVMNAPFDDRVERLRRIGESLQTIIPHFGELRAGHHTIPEIVSWPYLEARFDHWRDSETWQSDRHLSDGTLRLIEMLWAAQEHGGPLLIEEPEISLHDAVVLSLAGLFAQVCSYRERQVFVTTQAPRLLDDDAISPREIALLESTADGTSVSLAADDEQLCALIDGGHPPGEAVMPWAGVVSPRLSIR